jgi:hypothetical protein
MCHASALLYHVCAVASRIIRFASCGTSGKLTLWMHYVRTRLSIHYCTIYLYLALGIETVLGFFIVTLTTNHAEVGAMIPSETQFSLKIEKIPSRVSN